MCESGGVNMRRSEKLCVGVYACVNLVIVLQVVVVRNISSWAYALVELVVHVFATHTVEPLYLLALSSPFSCWRVSCTHTHTHTHTHTLLYLLLLTSSSVCFLDSLLSTCRCSALAVAPWDEHRGNTDTTQMLSPLIHFDSLLSGVKLSTSLWWGLHSRVEIQLLLIILYILLFLTFPSIYLYICVCIRIHGCTHSVT